MHVCYVLIQIDVTAYLHQAGSKCHVNSIKKTNLFWSQKNINKKITKKTDIQVKQS